MIRGIGVDVVDIKRFEQALENTPKLRERLFCDSERQLNLNSLAARFAAKEAFIKAVGKANGISFQEVCVNKDSEGKPFFELSGTTEQAVAKSGIDNLHLSLSHDGGLAIAYVIAESAE
jgi:holo-[acyl-carrier protein] synthase